MFEREDKLIEDKLAVYSELAAPEERLKPIHNDDEYSEASRHLLFVKDFLNKVEEDKKETVDPIRKGLDALYKKYRQARQPWEAAERTLKTLISTYAVRKQTKLLQAARKKAQKLIADGKNEQAADLISDAANKRCVPNIDGIQLKSSWAYDILDENAIPREFLTVDTKKISAVVKAMKEKTDIPGVTAFPAKQVAVKV